MPGLQQLLDASHVDPANLAGIAEINTVQHPDRPGRDIVATADPDTGVVHGRVHQPHGQLAFEVRPQTANGLHHHGKLVFRGYPQASGKRRLHAGTVQARLDLRAGTKGNHQPHAETAQQCDVMDDVDEIAVLYGIPRNGQHHRAPAVGVDVGG